MSSCEARAQLSVLLEFVKLYQIAMFAMFISANCICITNVLIIQEVTYSDQKSGLYPRIRTLCRSGHTSDKTRWEHVDKSLTNTVVGMFVRICCATC